jgi:drug/metabolite transporter (DMT)-like permease
MQTHRLRGYALILVAATLWGTLGIIFKALIGDYGLSRITIAFFRASVSAVILLAALALRRPGVLRIARRDVILFVAFGLFGIAAFYIAYVTAVDLTGVSVAAVLLYTAPAWVGVISALFLGERLTRRTIAAVALAMIGCALVARIYDVSGLRLNLPGILAGLGAGLSYALYSVFNKIGVRRYDGWTVLAYALLFGTVFLAPLQSSQLIVAALRQPGTVAWLLMLALGPTLGSGLTFNAGLRYIPVSNASVVATLEPVIASLLAFIFLHERLDLAQLGGGALILVAVISLTRPETKTGHLD